MSANDANGVDYSTPSSSSYTTAEQPVSHFGNTATVAKDDQAATSSTLEASNKVKNKKRQPKYRATKRPPSERRFQCEHCESRFFTQKDVKRHLVVHTGIRNFACPYCTQRFGRKDHLVRHAKKSHDQDTRSLKRRSRAPSLDSPTHVAAASTTTAVEPKKSNRRSRSKRKAECDPFSSDQPSSTASTATVTTTSPSTSYYLHDDGFSSGNRVGAAATSTNPNYSNSIMLSSTSTSLNASPLHPFPKMTLVDAHSSTSTLTASSFTHPRNYPSSFNYESAGGSNFNYNINGATFTNQFLPPESNSAQYPLQLPPPPNAAYLNYDGYKPPPNNSTVNYPGGGTSHHEGFATSSTGHLAGVAANSGTGNLPFKTGNADSFSNTCLELQYSPFISASTISSSVAFDESGHHATRFHTPFN